MTWFTELTGIDEQSPAQVRAELAIQGDQIVCPTGKRIAFGRLETPALSELRQSVVNLNTSSDDSTVSEIVGDAQQLHADPANANALFQVASQFNLLEMAAPMVTPEHGVGIYELDPTQGPACAIACGGGTIFRNYFVPVGDSIGQSADKQVDCSSLLGKRIGNAAGRLWSMQNGYLFPTDEGLREISAKLKRCSDAEIEELGGELQIGLQWQADVTLAGSRHKVSQAYCSALPVAYGRQSDEQWTDLAKLILDAAYEATLCAAVVNASQTGVNTVFLTLLGGGVFGNRDSWITDAIEHAFQRHRHHGLDVRIVSFRQSNPCVAQLVRRINQTHDLA